MSTIASFAIEYHYQKPFYIEAPFQRTANRKWPTGKQTVMWPMS